MKEGAASAPEMDTEAGMFSREPQVGVCSTSHPPVAVPVPQMQQGHAYIPSNVPVYSVVPNDVVNGIWQRGCCAQTTQMVVSILNLVLGLLSPVIIQVWGSGLFGTVASSIYLCRCCGTTRDSALSVVVLNAISALFSVIAFFLFCWLLSECKKQKGMHGPDLANYCEAVVPLGLVWNVFAVAVGVLAAWSALRVRRSMPN
mmetsp:Transcript_46543/g.95221  ORF Transcript_46543/g.95221 Transcript_46543/m.95221 type:complete len:201 (-) Transcript_46543:49-651(-)